MRWTALAVLLLLSGCLADSSATIEVDRDGGPTDRDGTVPCGDTAQLDLSVTVRGGDLRVMVLDGDGAVAFNETYDAPEGGEVERGLFGAPGDWMLTVSSGDFDGRLRATLSCD